MERLLIDMSLSEDGSELKTMRERGYGDVVVGMLDWRPRFKPQSAELLEILGSGRLTIILKG